VAAGCSVFPDARADQDVRVHFLTHFWQNSADIRIQNNIFDPSDGAYSYHCVERVVGFVTRNNTIRLKAETKMEFQRTESVEEFAA